MHLDYPDAMSELAEKLNISIIDLCEMSKNLLQETGEEDSKKYFMHLKKGEFIAYIDGLVIQSI